MPQININEIDQSNYIRVNNSDKVKVLIPGIASFGPVYDKTQESVPSFTNKEAFYKVFGYTEPEFNPFNFDSKSRDVSRFYAMSLMDNGAEVAFIRLNKGTTATFDIGNHNGFNFLTSETAPGTWRTGGEFYIAPNDETSSKITITGAGTTEDPYVPTYEPNKYYMKNVDGDDYYSLTYVKPSNWGTGIYYVKDGTGYSQVTFTNTGTETAPVWSPNWAENTYYTKDNSSHRIAPQSVKNGKKADTDFSAPAYTFCSQIKGISAKYSGSFGNNLLITIAQVNSENRASTYQYALITVYKVDFFTATKKNSDGNWTTEKKIKSAMKLESNIVTTNPFDANYFEDVEFDYITIEATETARSELSVTWSNPDGNIVTNGSNVVSGFPTIELRYKDELGNTLYNADALLGIPSSDNNTTGADRGWDFNFSDELKAILIEGFGGLNISQGKYSIQNINKYIFESYIPAESSEIGGVTYKGVVNEINENLIDCYSNYSDPYIYDFDFITSGGLLGDKYSIWVGNTAEEPVISWDADSEDITTTQYNTIVNATSVAYVVGKYESSENAYTERLRVHNAMCDLVTERQDCIALIDTPFNWSPETLPNYVNTINTSYATVHAPWCYVNNLYDNRLTLMPPSFIFLMTMLENLINNVEAQKWFPPAGVTRATARIVVKPQYEINSTILNQWQNDTLARVNPIMKLKNFGYVIYGQYTARVALDANSYSALDCLNVRITGNCVKKQIFNTCLSLAFEPNNSNLWLRFYDAMNKYLLFMKRNDGVYDYKVLMDNSTVTTDDINQLRCPGKVWINPTRTAEFFDIDFIITEAGVTFTNTIEEGE